MVRLSKYHKPPKRGKSSHGEAGRDSLEGADHDEEDSRDPRLRTVMSNIAEKFTELERQEYQKRDLQKQKSTLEGEVRVAQRDLELLKRPSLETVGLIPPNTRLYLERLVVDRTSSIKGVSNQISGISQKIDEIKQQIEVLKDGMKKIRDAERREDGDGWDVDGGRDPGWGRGSDSDDDDGGGLSIYRGAAETSSNTHLLV